MILSLILQTETIVMRYFSLFILLVCSQALFAQLSITVHTAAEFLNALGPNRTIWVEPGDYVLSQAAFTPNDYIEWFQAYDGPEATLKGVKNLTIKGKGNPRILTEPRYAWVLAFRESGNLHFEGITFGHTEAGYCEGGVLLFDKCHNITIKNCNLYGSGTVGLTLNEVKQFSFLKSHIYECTYAIMSLNLSSNLIFSGASFTKTGSFDLVEIVECNQVSFEKCKFSDNFNDPFAPWFFRIDSSWLTEFNNIKPGNSRQIIIKSCLFENNNVHKFCNEIEKLTLEKNSFKNNLFIKP